MDGIQIAIAVGSAVGGVALTLISQLLLLNASARKEYKHTRMVALQSCVLMIDLLRSWTEEPSETEVEEQKKLWFKAVDNISHIGVFIPGELQNDFIRLANVALRSQSAHVALKDKSLPSDGDRWFFRQECLSIIEQEYASIIPLWVKRLFE